MKTIFVVSWFYPPVNSSEGNLCCKLLNASRFRYDVFTQKANESWSYGVTSEPAEREGIRCLYAEADDPKRWAEEAFRYFRAHREEYGAVMTRSMPPESHRAGLLIKRAFPDIPWIASFGDPIRNNPCQLLDGSLYGPYSLKGRRRDSVTLSARLSPRRLLLSALWTLRSGKTVRLRRELARTEKQTLALADRLVFNNLSQLRYMTDSRKQRDKAVVVRHCFDPRLYPPTERTDGGARTRFVFLGQLNPIRSAMPLLQAVSRLKACTDDLSERAEFCFFGDMPDGDLAFILRSGLTDLVRVGAPVSYRQSLAEAAAADWLIHIDADLSPVCGENIFFAGKLADYFGAKKPILAITMPRGDAADCLRQAGALVLSYSVNEIKEYLYLILYQSFRVSPNLDYLQSFSASSAAKELDEKAVKPLYES